MQSEVIVLVGPMGVGKTTVGKRLASTLNMDFRDTDRIFIDRHGPIADFFELKGEADFRTLEESIVAEAIMTAGVVATGGGAVLSEETRAKLKETTVVYLMTDGTHMANRLSQSKRPLIRNGLSDWKQIYDQRRPIYEAIANITVDCSGQAIRDTVTEIVQALDGNE
jgi:shikimate kinase